MPSFSLHVRHSGVCFACRRGCGNCTVCRQKKTWLLGVQAEGLPAAAVRVVTDSIETSTRLVLRPGLPEYISTTSTRTGTKHVFLGPRGVVPKRASPRRGAPPAVCIGLAEQSVFPCASKATHPRPYLYLTVYVSVHTSTCTAYARAQVLVHTSSATVLLRVAPSTIASW